MNQELKKLETKTLYPIPEVEGKPVEINNFGLFLAVFKTHDQLKYFCDSKKQENAEVKFSLKQIFEQDQHEAIATKKNPTSMLEGRVLLEQYPPARINKHAGELSVSKLSAILTENIHDKFTFLPQYE